jgi:hypothetical protein
MAPSSTSHPASQSSPPQEHSTITPPKRSLRSRGSNAAANNTQDSTGGGGDASGMEVDIVDVGGDARGKFPFLPLCRAGKIKPPSRRSISPPEWFC